MYKILRLITGIFLFATSGNIFSQVTTCDVYLTAFDYLRNYFIVKSMSIDTFLIDKEYYEENQDYYEKNKEYDLREKKKDIIWFLNNSAVHLRSVTEDSCFKCNIPFIENDTLNTKYSYYVANEFNIECLITEREVRALEKKSDIFFYPIMKHATLIDVSSVLFINREFAFLRVTLSPPDFFFYLLLKKDERAKTGWKVIRSAGNFCK